MYHSRYEYDQQAFVGTFGNYELVKQYCKLTPHKKPIRPLIVTQELLVLYLQTSLRL